jgi:hypothetical protein
MNTIEYYTKRTQATKGLVEETTVTIHRHADLASKLQASEGHLFLAEHKGVPLSARKS